MKCREGQNFDMIKLKQNIPISSLEFDELF